MGIAVTQLFDRVQLRVDETVGWNQKPTIDGPGVYAVSIARDPAGHGRLLRHAPIDEAQVECWLAVAKERGRPFAKDLSLTEFVAQLQRCWIPTESVLYIGMTRRTLKDRIEELFRHKIGRRSPHAGGQRIKTLLNMKALFVHMSRTDNPEAKEIELLSAFHSAVRDARGVVRRPFVNGPLRR